MTLIEVVLALAIVVFCLVSIMGLLPKMLDATRNSRDKALTQRMYQTVTSDLHESPISAGEKRTYSFDMEGLLLAIEPDRPGQISRTGVTRFKALAEDNSIAELPETSPNEQIILSKVQFKDAVRNLVLLQRPIWTTCHD